MNPVALRRQSEIGETQNNHVSTNLRRGLHAEDSLLEELSIRVGEIGRHLFWSDRIDSLRVLGDKDNEYKADEREERERERGGRC